MASSEKTPRLGLNRWLGEDKPKREDFNGDNQILDEAFGGAEERCAALEKQAGELAGAQRSLEGLQEGLRQSLGDHAQDAVAHVTREDRESWGKSGMHVNLYIGTGEPEFTINVGFTPQSGFIFPANQPIVKPTAVANELTVSSAFFSAYGCSRGVTLTEKGFRITHSLGVDGDNVATNLNQLGVRYVYFAWE